LVGDSSGKLCPTIERWLQQIVFALDIDRGTIMYIEPANGDVSVTHQFAQEGINALPSLPHPA
jgi:hypothetical protein